MILYEINDVVYYVYVVDVCFPSRASRQLSEVRIIRKTLILQTFGIFQSAEASRMPLRAASSSTKEKVASSRPSPRKGAPQRDEAAKPH